MKLYNLFESVILEEIEKAHKIVSEGVSNDIINTIINGENGKFFHVNIKYRNADGKISERWIQIYQYVTTKAKNDAISAWQVSENGVVNTGWKIFRLDRIENIKPSRVPFYKPISDKDPSAPKFKPFSTGPNSPVLSVNKIANFNYQYKPSTIKQQARQKDKALTQKAEKQTTTKSINKPNQIKNKKVSKENNLEPEDELNTEL